MTTLLHHDFAVGNLGSTTPTGGFPRRHGQAHVNHTLRLEKAINSLRILSEFIPLKLEITVEPPRHTKTPRVWCTVVPLLHGPSMTTALTHAQPPAFIQARRLRVVQEALQEWYYRLGVRE